LKSIGFTCYLLCFSFGFGQVSDFKHIDFTQADKNALAQKGASLKNLPELVNTLTLNLNTDVERFRAIYKWVCTNISNDYKLFYKNKRKRRRYMDDSLKLEHWNKDFSQRIFKKLLKSNTTICSGYAYLVTKMAQMANLKCETINGFAKTSTTNIKTLDLPNHAWNAVLLNGKWYLCDPTWSAGKQNPDTGRFEFEYTDGFFLANPELFRVNHFPIEVRWQNMHGMQQSYNAFIESPILYNASYDYLNAIDKPQKSYVEIEKNTTLCFGFQLKKPLKKDAVKLRIVNGTSDKKIVPQAIEISEHQLQFRYGFSKTGWYDVHVYLEDTPVMSLTAKVKRHL